MIGHSCYTVSSRSYWCAFHIVQRYKHTFISLTSDSHTTDITHFTLVDQMYNPVVQELAHHIECQDISAQVHHSDAIGQSASIARTGRHSPTSVKMKVEQHVCLSRTPMTKNYWELKVLSSNKLHLLQVLKIMVFRRHGGTWVRFTEQPNGTQNVENFQYHRNAFLTAPNT